MGKLRQINERNQITIPASLLKSIGAKTGDLMEFELKGENLVLKPRKIEEKLEAQDWDNLDELISQQVKKGNYREYSSPHKARGHFKRLTRPKSE